MIYTALAVFRWLVYVSFLAAVLYTFASHFDGTEYRAIASMAIVSAVLEVLTAIYLYRRTK